MPIEANDSYQKATGTINIVVDAVQARNNINDNGTVKDISDLHKLLFLQLTST